MKQHKLAGKAIKGDGTEATAKRIKAVFEADGITNKWGYELSVEGYYFIDHDDNSIEWEENYYMNQHDIIPLPEAEALVFGELKAGMMVTANETYSWLKKGAIYEVSEWNGSRLRLIPLGTTNEVISASTAYVKYLSQATIRDFLRTLPEWIAERALRQVDEGWTAYEKYPIDLDDAVGAFANWETTNEGYAFWEDVSLEHYDRARELLQPERVGKWWDYPTSGTLHVTSKDKDGNLYGYGINRHGNWFDRTDESSDYVGCPKEHTQMLTPADPKEVEQMLDTERVKRGLVEGIEFVPLTVDGGQFSLAKCEVREDRLKYGLQGENSLSVKTSAFGWFRLFSNGKWAEIIEEQADPMCDSELPHSDKPDKFPRMMWVWDHKPEDAEVLEVDRYESGTKYPWWSDAADFRYASDTHPVTGEPAQTDVIAQIREVVERWEQQLEKYRNTKDDTREVEHNIFKAKYKFQQLRDDLKQIKETLNQQK